jgi:hypothetical protein
MNHGWNGSPVELCRLICWLEGFLTVTSWTGWTTIASTGRGFFREGQMARENVWTGEARRVLYQQLLKRFGPLKSWKNTSSPGGKLDKEFEKFCTEFANVIGAKSGEAVQHQIRFALPETPKGSTWTGQAQTATLNKAAALEAGFIENKHLPELLAVGREAK